MFERKRYQFGYVRQKPRKTGSHVWVWEYRDGSGSHSVILGTADQMSEAEAWKATEGRRLILNDPVVADQTSFGAVLDRYLLEALPERKVTRCTYLSWIKSRIRPKWGGVCNRARKTSRCRIVDQRVATFRQEQRAHSRGDAHALRLGYAMGIDPA